MKFKSLERIRKLNYWVQMVLPTVYDDSLSYMELLNKVVVHLNETIEGINLLADDVEYLKWYIENWIATVDIAQYVNNWLEEHPEATARDYNKPETYGAIGDGITDDTEAIQKCLDDNNFSASLLSGNYLVSSTINVPSNHKIFGGGNLIRESNKLNYNILEITSAEKINIKDICITGSGDLITPEQGFYEIYINDGSDITIDNIIIKNSTEYGCIGVDASHNIRIENCYIHTYTYSGISFRLDNHDCDIFNNKIINCTSERGLSYAITLCGGTLSQITEERTSYNMRVENNYIYNFKSDWEGIDAHGLKNSIISNNIIYNCYRGIGLVTPVQSSTVIKNVTVQNNIIIYDITNLETYTRGVESGIIIQALDYSTPLNNSVDNNIIEVTENNGLYGILVSGGNNVKLTNNTITNFNIGVNLTYLFNNIFVKNNIIRKCNDTGVLITRASGYQNNAFILDNYIEAVNYGGAYTPTETPPYYGSRTYFKFANNTIFAHEKYEQSHIVYDIGTQPPNYGRAGDICTVITAYPYRPFGWICNRTPTSEVSVNWAELPLLEATKFERKTITGNEVNANSQANFTTQIVFNENCVIIPISLAASSGCYATFNGVPPTQSGGNLGYTIYNPTSSNRTPNIYLTYAIAPSTLFRIV